jgi:hypothetical protein
MSSPHQKRISETLRALRKGAKHAFTSPQGDVLAAEVDIFYSAAEKERLMNHGIG